MKLSQNHSKLRNSAFIKIPILPNSNRDIDSIDRNIQVIGASQLPPTRADSRSIKITVFRSRADLNRRDCMSRLFERHERTRVSRRITFTTTRLTFVSHAKLVRA